MARPVTIYLGAASVQTALGDLQATLRAMAAGQTGLRCDAQLGMVAGRIAEAPAVEGLTRFEALLVRQIDAVTARSGVRLAEPDTQLVISTTKGNVALLGDEGRIPDRARLSASAERIAARYGCARRPVVVSHACISGLSAMIVARRMLLAGECRHVVVAGCDELSEFIAAGFASFRSVSERPCRPYDAARDGLSLGEACGAVVLTADEAVAERPLVRLTGGAVTNDANHISGPSRTGDGLCFAIRQAMEEAGIAPDEAGFVNAHGTATRYNDEMESKALEWAGLAGRPLNGLKGYIGHTLGASGVVEAIICAEELRRGAIFGTTGFAEQGTPVALRLSAGEQAVEAPCCIKTASGFGGCNAAIVLDAGAVRPLPEGMPRRGVTVAREYELPQSELPFAEFIRAEYRQLGDPNMKFFKMSDLCKALYIAAERLLHGAGLEAVAPERRAVVLANAAASLEADAEHRRIIGQRLPEGASPAVFVYTLPNVAAGELCIRHKFQGDNTFFIERSDSGLAEAYARQLIAEGRADAAVCGWCDKLGETWNVKLKLLKTE